MFTTTEIFLLLLLVLLFSLPVVQNLYRAWAEPSDQDEEASETSVQ